MKLIKSVENKRFQLKLIEHSISGLYYVCFSKVEQAERVKRCSDGFDNLKTALDTFEQYLITLEGN